MNRKPIMFDLDGVVVDLVSTMLPLLSSLKGVKVSYRDITDHDIPKALALNISDETLYQLVENDGGYLAAHPISDAITTLRSLRSAWTIVTSRPLRLREATLQWLERHLGFVPMLSFADRRSKYMGKSPLLIVDDDPVALAAAPKSIRKILFDQPWNRKARFHRVDNWRALERILLDSVNDGILDQ